MTMRAQIVPLEGGTPIEVIKDMTLVGRGEECDIRLEHKSISKIHCVLVKTDGVLLLRDLGSTNGTRVNGTRVRRAVLLPNDKLSIANRHFRALFGAALENAEPEKTIQLEVSADLRQAIKAPGMELNPADSAADVPIIEVQANSLPDVYPENEHKKHH
jgi:pSer/pThr/pTyr-binding forkhead associated (FHA) protein